MTEEQAYIIWLSSIHQIGPKKYKDLMRYYGSAKAVYERTNKKGKEKGLAGLGRKDGAFAGKSAQCKASGGCMHDAGKAGCIGIF